MTNESDSTTPYYRENSNLQATARIENDSLPPAPRFHQEYSGVEILTDPANIDCSYSKAQQNYIMGSPNLPVFIKVKKDPEPAYMKFLHILQLLSGIFFIFFIIGLIISQLSNENGIGGSLNLKNAAGSHHEIVISSNVKFDDVQGCDEVKAQLVQVVDFLKNPFKYERYGAVMPRGYLLEGPPGVGKTLLAKAVAGEANVPFIVISGAEFDEIYTGVGASRVRSLFSDARKFGKAVVFIDEIDAVAGKRGAKDRSSDRQTLNQLLVEMDGFKTNSNIIILGATNTVQSLDPALLRPGRFDKTLTIMPPDIAGRKQILKRIFSKIPKNMLSKDINADDLASSTIGYTGADLENLINQAKLNAATDGSSGVISKANLMKAKDFVDMGPERNMVMSSEDRERVAFHEAGHAVVGLYNPSQYKVLQATIVPHSNALGLVLSAPENDKCFHSKSQLESIIDRSFGGFIAEEIKYGPDNVSDGPASDLVAANSYARHMVKSGFGKRTKFLLIPQNTIEASETSKKNFDDDVQDILNESQARVRNILTEKILSWEAIAKVLLEKETLDKTELQKIFKNPHKYLDNPKYTEPMLALKSKTSKRKPIEKE